MTIKIKLLPRKFTFVASVVVSALLLGGCQQSGVADSDRMLNPYVNKPEVAWTANWPGDLADISHLRSWPERSAVVGVFYRDFPSFEPTPAPAILVFDVDTGAVIDEADVGDLAPVEGLWSDYYVAAEILRSGELMIQVSPAEATGDTHFIMVPPTSFDDAKTVSRNNAFFGALPRLDFDKDVLYWIDGDSNDLQFLGPDLEVLPGSQPLNVESYWFEGSIPSMEAVLFADLSSDRSVVFEFYDPDSGMELHPSLVLPRASEQDFVFFVGELGGDLLFASSDAGGEQWELILVDWEGDILNTRNVRVAEGSSGSPNDFVAVNSGNVFLIEESGNGFSVVVLNSTLQEIEALPVDGVNELSFLSRWTVSGPERGDRLVVSDESSFALLDTASNGVSQFRTLSDWTFEQAVVGFSRDALFVEEPGVLTSYSLALEPNWSFDMRLGQRIIRAGRYLFLVDDQQKTLMLLADGR